MSGGHSGEEIPVPIPNTEVKLSNADDTASRGGKVGSRRAFFLSFYFDGERLFTGVPLFFLTTCSWGESCAAVEGFPARPERAARRAAPSVSGPWKRSFQMESGMRLFRAAWWNLSARKRNQKKKCFLFDINAD